MSPWPFSQAQLPVPRKKILKSLGKQRFVAAIQLMEGLNRGFTPFLGTQFGNRRGFDGPIQRDTYSLSIAVSSAIFDSKSHRMRHFGCGENVDVKPRREASLEPRITLDEAKRICTELYHINDDRFPLKFTEVHESRDRFNMWAQPDVGPRMLWQQGECIFEVSRHRGVVVSAYLGYAPELRFADAPVVEVSVARAAAIDAYLRYKPFAWTEFKGTGLGLAAPRFFRPREFTDELMELGLANIAIPIYITYFFDPSSYLPAHRVHALSQFVYVDGRTGRAIAISDSSGGLFTMNLPAERPAPPIADWTTVQDPTGSGPPTSVTLRPSVPHPRFEFAGRPVTVRNGDTLVSGEYDGFLRLFRVRHGGGTRWYSVSGPGALALRRWERETGGLFGARKSRAE